MEADLSSHGLPTLVGVLDLVQNETIIDFKTSGTTPNADRAVLVNGTQATAYSLLYRENTGRKEAGIELHHLVKLKAPSSWSSTCLLSETENARGSSASSTPTWKAWNGATSFPHRGCNAPRCEFFQECAAWH